MFSIKEKTAVSLLSIVPTASICLFLARYGTKFVDDGYYYLQIAYNASRGKGFSFDGIHLTNGFQPLWQVLLIPFFLLTDVKSPVPYMVSGLQFALYTAGSLFLFLTIKKLTKSSGIALSALFIWLWNPWLLLKGALTGMETALLLMLLGLFYYTVVHNVEGRSRFFLTGILAALTVAARLDSLFLVIAAAIVYSFYFRSYKIPVIVISPSLVYLGLYAAINIRFLGFPLPISGTVKAAYGKRLIENLLTHGDLAFFHHFFQNAVRFFTLDRISIFASAVVLSGTAVLFFRILLRLRGAGRVILIIHFLYSALLFAFYFSLYENILYTYKYYWLPPIFGFVIFFSLATGDVPRSVGRSLLIALAVIFTTVFSAVYINGLLHTFYYSQSQDSFPLNRLVSFITKQVPEQSRIGSWDAGYIGYHVDRTVINLDGLVNNYEWLEYFQNDRLADYIVDKDIRYLANYKNTHWPEMIRIAEQLGWSKIYADTLEFSDSGRVTKFTTNPAYLDKSNRSVEFYIFSGSSRSGNY